MTTPSSARPRTVAPPRPPAPAAQFATPRRADVVVRTLGLRLLAVGGILHASSILMALVVILVMALGGDSRVSLVMKTIRETGSGVWTWTLFALFTSIVLGFVMLYNAIGMLSLTPWSQRATKIWSSVWLAMSIAAVAVNMIWIYPALNDASPDRFSSARTMLATMVHIVFGVVWPGIVLFYMSTRQVKQAYARVAGGAAAM